MFFKTFLLVVINLCLWNGLEFKKPDIDVNSLADIIKDINDTIANSKDFEIPRDYSQFKPNQSDGKIENYGTYDFIIVGTGASASIITYNLQKYRQDWNILVLEAAEPDNDKDWSSFDTIPGLTPWLARSDKNWGFQTTSQENGCHGQINKQCNLLHGKHFGGNTATFQGLYVRGDANDYSKANDILSEFELFYFKAAEFCSLSCDGMSEKYHGTYEGFIPTTLSRSDFNEIITQALEENGQSLNDYNDLNQNGYYPTQLSATWQERMSSKVVFAQMEWPEVVKIVPGAFATKLHIDEDTVFGITFTKDGKTYNAFVKNELILATGPINTASLLLKSGIGPKKELEKNNVDLFADLPVGQMYSEQMIFPGLRFRINKTVESQDLEYAILDWAVEANGDTILHKYMGVTLLDFVKVGANNDTSAALIFVPPSGLLLEHPALVQQNYDETSSSFFQNVSPTEDLTILVATRLSPEGGKITLKSNDVYDHPNVDPNIFGNSEDLDNVYEAIQKALELLDTEAFKSIGAELVADVPGCGDVDENPEAYWKCAIKLLAYPGNFPTSTTPIGSVLDNHLRVKGLSRIRIADTGALSSPVLGESSTVEYFIGGVLGDLLIREYA